ncbi:MAG: 4-(cytidine 5'-diphospho)-2-C-methyl-D-erythritol kinase [Xanthobacteraceae bacterium]|nr:4-(cytidine 5'-diphospho)-2-C-methyl-D-erythritol kinase [Xanthobacteraceae bacterium]
MAVPTPAPAKVNLFLHVGSLRADGYHLIESLVAFADIGDELRFSPGGEGFSIRVEGRFAKDAGAPEKNLVLKAADALSRKLSGISGGEFLLTKNLPAGAGLGGGSSDAAAALRMLAAENGLISAHPAILAAARETGADVAVCLEGKARFITGIGDILSAPVSIPALPAVLVWPGAPASTPDVYRAFDEAEMKHSTPFGVQREDIPTERDAFIEFLKKRSNDLTRAAWRVTPYVAEADAVLRAVDRTQLIRMSGSGSAVFAIYASLDEAEAEAKAVRDRYPNWWVKATTLR